MVFQWPIFLCHAGCECILVQPASDLSFNVSGYSHLGHECRKLAVLRNRSLCSRSSGLWPDKDRHAGTTRLESRCIATVTDDQFFR